MTCVNATPRIWSGSVGTRRGTPGEVDRRVVGVVDDVYRNRVVQTPLGGDGMSLVLRNTPCPVGGAAGGPSGCRNLRCAPRRGDSRKGTDAGAGERGRPAPRGHPARSAPRPRRRGRRTTTGPSVPPSRRGGRTGAGSANRVMRPPPRSPRAAEGWTLVGPPGAMVPALLTSDYHGGHDPDQEPRDRQPGHGRRRAPDGSPARTGGGACGNEGRDLRDRAVDRQSPGGESPVYEPFPVPDSAFEHRPCVGRGRDRDAGTRGHPIRSPGWRYRGREP